MLENFLSLELLGFLGGTLTSIAFLPQVFKIYKTQSADDLSMGMFLIFSTGVCLWLWYGILSKSWPLIFANAFTLIFCFLILAMAIHYKRRSRTNN